MHAALRAIPAPVLATRFEADVWDNCGERMSTLLRNQTGLRNKASRVDPALALGVTDDELFIARTGMAVGNCIGPYRIFETLGRGGMGVVYRARHIETEQTVALKTVHSAARWTLECLRREIVALSMVRHPGVVRIVDHGTHDGLPWYAMDLIEGESLRRFVRRIWSPHRSTVVDLMQSDVVSATQPLYTESEPPADLAASVVKPEVSGARPAVPTRPPVAAGELKAVLSIVERVCETLAFLHGEGFINCDLKPENILLIAGAPIVIDFGLAAHHPGSSGREALEAQRAMAGTLHYMSPEQIRGDFVDARTDLYAVGCILYELLVGEPPFSGNPSGLVARHLGQPPIPPSRLVEGMPDEVEQVVLRLLSKELSQRFGYADEVARILATLGGQSPRTSTYPAARPYLYRPRFVGREEETRRIADVRESALQGDGAFVLVGGESGVGKTRLAMELTRLATSSPVRVITGEARPPSAIAPAPLQALRSLLLAVADSCQEGGADVTERLLGAGQSELALYEPLLAQVPTHEQPTSVLPLPVHESRKRLFRMLRETLAALAREQPLVWVIDDLSFADELSLDFLASITAEFLSANPLLIVATYRSEEPSDSIAAIARQPHVSHLVLLRLDRSGVHSMIRDMLAMSEPANDFTDFVAQQTEGNPFFVTEYLRGAVAEHVIYRDHDNWCLPSPADTQLDYTQLPIPHTLRELIERRLTTLSATGKQACIATAVLGRESETEVLQVVLDLPDDAFARSLDELLRRQVLEQPRPGVVRFVHDKLREVCYSTSNTQQLIELHARAGETLEAWWQRRPNDSRGWATLGHHFAAANRPTQAAPYLHAAADHARLTHANGEALRLYQMALEQTQIVINGAAQRADSWISRLEKLMEARGDVLSLTTQRQPARDAYEQALEHVTPEQPQVRARLYRKLGKTWESQHEYDRALACFEQAQNLLGADVPTSASELRDEWIQVRVEQLSVYYWLDRVPEMNGLIDILEPLMQGEASPLQRASFYHARASRNLRRDRYVIREETLRFARLYLGAAEESADFGHKLYARFFVGLVLVLQGQASQGALELSVALQLAERAGDLTEQARCLTYLALAARMRGAVEEAAAFTERAAAMSETAGVRDYVAAAHANQAWLALRHGDLPATLDRTQRAVGIWKGELALVFPLQWMALLPGVEAAVKLGQVEVAITYARDLLGPRQQPLPGAVTDAFTRACRSWDARNFGAALQDLNQALQSLSGSGYR